MQRLLLVQDSKVVPLDLYAEWDESIISVHQEYFTELNDPAVALLGSHVHHIESTCVSIHCFSSSQDWLIKPF